MRLYRKFSMDPMFKKWQEMNEPSERGVYRCKFEWNGRVCVSIYVHLPSYSDDQIRNNIVLQRKSLFPLCIDGKWVGEARVYTLRVSG